VSAAAARMKPQYGPSLPRLLAPRWRAASPALRAAVLAAAAAGVLLALAAGLALENASYSRGGRVPFSFEYRGLYAVAPEAGGFVRVQSRFADGALKYSYAVGPLSLPPYAGAVQGELPLYATGFVRSLARRYRDFALRGEGKSKVNNSLIGYQVAFTAEVAGAKMYGRDVLFTAPVAHPRAGLVVSMLEASEASESMTSPLEVAETGVLLRPLKTLTLG
jgi:hypothetical protein